LADRVPWESRHNLDADWKMDSHREKTTHSDKMFMGFETVEGTVRRYVIKEFGSDLRPLLAREVGGVYFGVGMGLAGQFLKTCFDGNTMIRRFAKGFDFVRVMKDPDQYPAHIITDQMVLNGILVQAAACDTDRYNPGNVVATQSIEDRDPSRAANSPLVFIDLERWFPNQPMMNWVNSLSGTLDPIVRSFSHTAFWTPGSPYPGSIQWLAKRREKEGQEPLFESEATSMNPYLALLHHRYPSLSQLSELPMPMNVVRRTIENAAKLRGLLRFFEIYTSEELRNPDLPFNQIVCHWTQVLQSGKNLTLREVVTADYSRFSLA
jgi:hypothetical protein